MCKGSLGEFFLGFMAYNRLWFLHDRELSVDEVCIADLNQSSQKPSAAAVRTFPPKKISHKSQGREIQNK